MDIPSVCLGVASGAVAVAGLILSIDRRRPISRLRRRLAKHARGRDHVAVLVREGSLGRDSEEGQRQKDLLSMLKFVEETLAHPPFADAEYEVTAFLSEMRADLAQFLMDTGLGGQYPRLSQHIGVKPRPGMIAP